MKAEYINPFIKATIDVVNVMAFVKTKAKKPYLKKDDLATGDVSTIVGLTGEATGTFSISFDEPSIIKIASNMFGEEITKLDRDVTEVAGELANMISGQARREIESLGLRLDGAIPSIFSGKNHTIYHMTDGPKIAIPFIMDKGSFTMEVCFDF
ncbi:MAG: chemotaxis protein CheX [Desulfobacterium sp.]|nr:chemotaxis protein CheX [Desulfobacterium sp.]